jgi:23S rRNA (cytosine1962-C5)-methyltransferase
MKSPPRKPARRSSSTPIPKRSLDELLAQRPLTMPPDETVHELEVRAPVPHPFLYRKRLGQFPRDAHAGDMVRLTHDSGDSFGWGLFNPHAEIAARLLTTDPTMPDETWWQHRLERAVRLRREVLKLDAVTNAYRVVHAEGDGLSGLVVDRFGDVLVVEAYALGMYQRAEAILDLLTPMCETEHGLLRCAPQSDVHEGFAAEPIGDERLPTKVTIQEFGTQFKIDFAGGQKTGFYCDQRDNRRRVAQLCASKRVLDLCSYTGGFAVQAQVLGRAGETTAVELDEAAVETARGNARLNKAKIHFVQADAFAYAKDMLRNGQKYDVIILDPPKLIRTREEGHLGRRKYFDLNRLAMQLLSPNGLIFTCSCSGLLEREEFVRLICAAVPEDRRAQILEQGGASADHPIAVGCPESEYLKTALLRVE